MEEQVARYQSLALKKRLIIMLILGISYPIFSFYENIDLVEENLDRVIIAENAASIKFKRATKTIANLPQLEKQQEEITSKLNKARTLLPMRIDFTEVLKKFADFEKILDIKMVTFSPKPLEQKTVDTNYATVPVSLKLSASFGKTLTFIDNIMHLKKLIHIEKLKMLSVKNISTSNNGRNPDLVNTEIRLNFFKGM
tara:strand:+ start:74 stop:664 length:591 start_codon:yes stop_codon:yes gene_type:complete